ncbi:MAG TPA: OB-fold domain-containing protein [Ramlibacter sp.]|nr:OB-fold domain-containing protein [Ramlibacter sp.]
MSLGLTWSRALTFGDVVQGSCTLAAVDAVDGAPQGPAIDICVKTEFHDLNGERVAILQEVRRFFDLAKVKPLVSRAAPMVGHDNAFWWEGVARRELRIQQCADCGQLRHPPRPMCPQCRSLHWAHIAASGRGTIHSYTVHHTSLEGLGSPYVVALIDLEEGNRLISNVIDVDHREVRIGMPVQVTFHHVGPAQMLPLFRPVAAGASLDGAAAAAEAGTSVTDVEVTATDIVVGALRAGNADPAHHDGKAAGAQGLRGICMDAVTTAALIEAQAWQAGLDMQRGAIDIRFGEPIYAGTALQLTREFGGSHRMITCRATSAAGLHAQATITEGSAP